MLTNYAEEQVAQWTFWLEKSASTPGGFHWFVCERTAPMSRLTDYDRRKADIYTRLRRVFGEMGDLYRPTMTHTCGSISPPSLIRPGLTIT
jgi:hypothetical protein